MIQPPYRTLHICFRREDKARKPLRDDASCVLCMQYNIYNIRTAMV